MALFILLSFCLILEMLLSWRCLLQRVVLSIWTVRLRMLECLSASSIQRKTEEIPAPCIILVGSHSRGADLTNIWTGDSYRPPETRVSVKCYYSVRVTQGTYYTFFHHSPPAPVIDPGLCTVLMVDVSVCLARCSSGMEVVLLQRGGTINRGGLNDPSPGISVSEFRSSFSAGDAPQLEVSPAEGGSVQLDCKAPYAGVSQCYFYPEGADTNVKLSSSCRLTLTGADLTSWTGRSYRPEPIRNQKLVFTMTVSMKSSLLSVKYRCQDQQELVLDVISTLDPDSTSVRSRVVSCDYSLTSHPSTRSPPSLTYDITQLLPPSFQPSVTEEESTAASPASSTRSITPTPPTTRSPGDPTSASVTDLSPSELLLQILL
ncbi:hypothetical protein NFI96_017436 [Prochilodus magdalenae]|nr:hypothetical protein NFI96_017436 [Prochilodus magdalenae]